MPTRGTGGVSVEAQQDVIVSDTPLGDVVNGTLAKGQPAAAACFVRQAATNPGFSGSAIKVEAGDVSGLTESGAGRARKQGALDRSQRMSEARLGLLSRLRLWRLA